MNEQDNSTKRTESEPDSNSHAVMSVALVPTVPGQYANNVGLIRTQHELTLDFFIAEPIGEDTNGRHIARIFLPLNVMKGLRDALAEHIEGYERDWGVELPNMRELQKQKQGDE